MARFEVKPVETWALYRDGEVVRDPEGHPVHPVTFSSAREAWEEVAENWGLHRLPTLDELEAMSDSDLRARFDWLARH